MNVAEAPVPRVALSYKEALAWLYSLQRFGIKLGLENIRRLIRALHLEGRAPRDRAGGKASRSSALQDMRVIHVAGTNGKGSVCAMIESVARAAGLRTGLFTSPHLVTFRERIRVNGEMISEDGRGRGSDKNSRDGARLGPAPDIF